MEKPVSFDDPRKAGYNYGAPLPIPSDDPLFNEASTVSAHLNDTANEASARAWRLTMALRDYRHAVTREERGKAGAKLATVLGEVSRFAPSNGGDPSPDYTFDEIASIGRRVAERESEYARRWLPKEYGREAQGEVSREAAGPKDVVVDGRVYSV